MIVDTDQKYQEKVESAANMVCQLKQIYQLSKGRDEMDIPPLEEVLNVSKYPMLEYMGFDTNISDGVAKMRSATFLRDIFRLRQCIKIR